MSQPAFKRTLIQVLGGKQKITREQALEAIQRRQSSSDSLDALEKILIAMGVAEVDVYEAKAEMLGAPFLDLSTIEINKEATSLLPIEMQKSYRLAPVCLDGTILTVAMENPKDEVVLNEMRKKTGLEVQAVLAPPSQITALQKGQEIPSTGLDSEAVEEHLITRQGKVLRSEYKPESFERLEPLASPKPVDTRLCVGYNEFGFRFLQQLSRRAIDQNIVVSALSIAIALAMTANGAGGATRQEMLKVLGIEAMQPQEINAASAHLQHNLRNLGSRIITMIANSIWARRGFEFEAGFLNVSREFFDAEVAALDFSNPEAPAIINRWVADSTRGKIDSVIDSIDTPVVMILINAIYFKAAWEHPFEGRFTKDRPFYCLDGRTKPAPLMSESGSYGYYCDEEFAAIRLPYDSGQVSMYILLPHERAGLPDFLQTLSGENLERWLARFEKRQGDIKLPRFQSACDGSIKEMLQAMGLQLAFDPDRANFEATHKGKPWIGEVRHHARIEVNEEGTECAAATLVDEILGAGRGNSMERFTFIADHPFLAIIRDDSTGGILFMSAVMEP